MGGRVRDLGSEPVASVLDPASRLKKPFCYPTLHLLIPKTEVLDQLVTGLSLALMVFGARLCHR